MIGHVAAGLAAGTGIAVALRLAERFEWARALRRETHGLVRSWGDGRIAAVSLAVAAVEEPLFRGVLLSQVGVLGSAALFALLHLGPRRRAWVPISFGAGLAFAALARATGDLAAPIAAHFAVDLLVIWRAARA